MKNYRIAIYLGLALSTTMVYGQKKEDAKDKDKTEKTDTSKKVKKLEDLLKKANILGVFCKFSSIILLYQLNFNCFLLVKYPSIPRAAILA